ncbi:CFEM domain-containing protein [Aspergillus ibericus CBS 121593]|uniref:CFEM domain-containing protein n=1 Tax=Aspergillus ibericus CBS 121593 TaxID=1448316 RepID=A0A395GR23_9EURO|nr:hypothetical protein BO80DRAFT_468074 [Aspergillus ibericus CBS 121593]RAK97177.1 hypothetical protein BO80DRAFT_468074 [Aspergillus ibericus CBS 121593]
MKPSLLILLSLLSLTTGQTIPQCLGDCVNSSTVCEAGDINCYCTNAGFQQGVRDCLNERGCQGDLQAGVDLQNEICG